MRTERAGEEGLAAVGKKQFPEIHSDECVFFPVDSSSVRLFENLTARGRGGYRQYLSSSYARAAHVGPPPRKQL